MGTSGPNRRGSFDLGEVAPFWLPPADSDGREIDDLVHQVAKELWPWAFRHVQKELHDGARALEIVQEVALDVSQRLNEDTEVGRNLKGYFTTSFIARMLREKLAISARTYGLTPPARNSSGTPQ
jgi:hypothetical protein